VLAQDLSGQYRLGRERAPAIVARALARGDLRAVRLSTNPATLGAATTEIRDIGDIDGPVVPAFPGGGDPDRPDGPAAPLSTTWISFGVVDERGDPVDGDFRIALDAAVHEGELDDETRLYEDIREAADVRLHLAHILWPFDADEPVEPTVDGPGAEDPAPLAPAPDTATTFEIVDADGKPWPAHFTLHRGEDVLAEGDLAGASDPFEEPGELALAVTLTG
jgi:hypothetical protein